MGRFRPLLIIFFQKNKMIITKKQKEELIRIKNWGNNWNKKQRKNENKAKKKI